jgi:hypothetical protein
MADQLLSQADVDALVASLTKNDSPKPVAAASPAPKSAAPVSAPAPSIKSTPVLVKPEPAPATAPAPKPAAAPASAKAATPIISTTKPETINTKYQGTTVPASRASESAIPKVMPSNQPEPKAEVSSEAVNGLNAKIADLSKQLNQINSAIKRLDGFEKKLNELTAKIEHNQESAQTAQKVQKLNDELKKIALNLKGTPGYGIKNNFDCEKCSDHGHVAVMFRCTSCGHERWYGWWPEK